MRRLSRLGLQAPAGSPDAVVHRLAGDVARTFALPGMLDWLTAHGPHHMGMT